MRSIPALLALLLLVSVATACKEPCASWPPAVRVRVEVQDPSLRSQIESLQVTVAGAGVLIESELTGVASKLADGETDFVVRLDGRGLAPGVLLSVEVRARGAGRTLASKRATWTNSGDGCENLRLVLGVPPDAGPPDGPPRERSVPDSRHDLKTGADLCTSAVATLEADACLVAGMDSANYGGADLCNLRYFSGKPSAALMRFQMPSTQRPSAFRLELTYALKSDACSTGCGDCKDFSIQGPYVARVATSAWDELTVAWGYREYTTQGAQVPWGIMTGGNEAGPEVATATHPGGTPDLVLMTTDAKALDLFQTWLSSGRISFLVKPMNATTAYVAAMREAGKCGNFRAPVLRLFYCSD